MAELLEDLFSRERDFAADLEKQVHGLCALVADPSGRSCALVAEKDGRVVGMTTVQTLISTAEGGRVGVVEDVIVAPGERGQGIGTRLLDSVVSWSKKKGLKRLQILSDRENIPALDFYHHRNWDGTRLICLRKPL